MPPSVTNVTRGTVFAAAALLALVATACGSGDGGVSLPTLPSTTTTAAGETTTTTERSTTTTEGGGTNTSAAESTTTTARETTTTTGEPSTTTTAEPTTTTTSNAPSTTTTTRRPSTTTTSDAPTTTSTAADTTTTAAIDADTASSDGTSPWLWIGAVALLLVAAAVAVFGVVRSRNAARARWLWGTRDLATRSSTVARSLDEAAALLAGPVAVDRRVWLDDVEALSALAGSAATQIPDVPSVPGDPEGTNSMRTALEALRTDLTVLRSASVEAERIRFELVGPTGEQLEFASRSVRQAAATVVSDAHAVSAAADRISPPPPVPPTGSAPPPR